jgi:hypothetical protein
MSKNHCYCSYGRIPPFTVANRLQNRSREVKCMVSKVEGGGLSGFEVEGGKSDFGES